MIDFPCSSFTWKSHPWQPDPYYRWAGGFVRFREPEGTAVTGRYLGRFW